MKTYRLPLCACMALAAAMPGIGRAQSLDVLHWRTSASERRAADQLGNVLASVGATKDAVAQTLWRYLSDPQLGAAQAQQRLAFVIRSP